MALQSTIVAQNASATKTDLFFYTAKTVAGDNNLIGVADAGNFTLSGSGNLTGTVAARFDPLLQPLEDNGGPTLTHALKANSLAVNRGNNSGGFTVDQRGNPRVIGGRADIGAFESNFLPVVNSVVSNDGSVQRSNVTSLTVTFSEVVTLSPGAFVLERIVGGSVVGTVTTAIDVTGRSATQTVAKLTFTGGDIETGTNSLIDGIFRLRIIGANVQNSGGGLLDGDNDGTAGGDYATPTTVAGIFRLLGDVNGDGVNDIFDFNALRTAINTNPGPSPLTPFDFDGDGIIDTTDFNAFRTRFNTSVL